MKKCLEKIFFSDFNLTPNSSLICFVELNNRFFVSKTVDWYLFKRLFRLTIVEWLSGRTVVIGSGYESKSLNRKNKKIHFHISKLTSTNLVPLDEFDVALKNRELGSFKNDNEYFTWSKRSGVFSTRCFEGDDVLEIVFGEITISWFCSDWVNSINNCSFSCLTSFCELKLIENESSCVNTFRFVVLGEE